MAFMSVGDTFSAVQDLEAAARAANRSVPEEAYLRERTLLALGLLYGEQGRLEDALGAFARMAPGGPLADRVRFGRGMAFFHHEDLVKAVAEFQALERDHPDSPYALEGALIMADAYRRLNAPLRAVTEYRKALESFRARAASTDEVLAEADGLSFDEGLTGLLFSDAWKGSEAREPIPRLEGLQLLLHTPGFAALLDEYRQVILTIDRLEGLNRRLAGRGQDDAAARVSAAVDRLGVFRSMFEAAARQAVIGILKDERERLEDLSLTASLGITQSILFDRMGADGRDLYFKDAP
jgi:tetratricopeptide (TPR) repeat protein